MRVGVGLIVVGGHRGEVGHLGETGSEVVVDVAGDAFPLALEFTLAGQPPAISPPHHAEDDGRHGGGARGTAGRDDIGALPVE